MAFVNAYLTDEGKRIIEVIRRFQWVVGIRKITVNRPPPLTEPERNAVKSLPTVTNGGTAQMVHRRAAIVAFLSDPVKGKPPCGSG